MSKDKSSNIMRCFSYFFFLLLFSCKGNIDDSDLDSFSNFSFSIDTVIIDPGDNILFLKYQLLNSDISKDGKYLLNFNEGDNTLEKINLNELRLEEKLPFEKEGPNGTGNYLGKLNAHIDNQIILTGMGRIEWFSLEGKKIKTIYLEDFSLDGEPISMDDLRRVRVPYKFSNRLYGIIYNYIDKSYALGILNLDNFKITKIELKSFETLSNYEVIFNSDGIQISYPPNIDLKIFETKVILSNEIGNTFTWYDTKIDSLVFRSYESQLTANKKEKNYKKEYGTSEELEEGQRKFRQEINFLSPFWEQDGKYIFRFSYVEVDSEIKVNGKHKAKVYLTIFDRDLKIVGEKLVLQLTKKPGKHFVKDGIIWMYENIDDEMGFIRLEMNEYK